MNKFYCEITSESDFAALVKAAKVCVVDFYADWCGPCKKLSPALAARASSDDTLAPYIFNDWANLDKNVLSNSVIFLKVNVDTNSELSQKFNVKSIPYIRFFHKGKLTEESVLGNEPAKIIDYVKKLL